MSTIIKEIYENTKLRFRLNVSPNIAIYYVLLMVCIIVCIFSPYIPGKTFCVIIGTAIAIGFTLNKLGWHKPHIRHRVRINKKEDSMCILPEKTNFLDIVKKLRQKGISFSEGGSCNYSVIRICLAKPKSDILIVKPYDDPDVLAGEKSFIQPHHMPFYGYLKNSLELPLDDSGKYPDSAPH